MLKRVYFYTLWISKVLCLQRVCVSPKKNSPEEGTAFPQRDIGGSDLLCLSAENLIEN